ncbi:MAG: ABC transporter ATP-binding protein [Thermoplasmata archaeon]|nr:ABC transporter ATP-binding protein [Thermoplasmata archaeon]
MPEIRITNLKKAFGDLVAIDDLTIDVKDGEYLTILGPTGAGKTTLLRLIAGLTEQTSGSIFIDGECVDDLPPERRKVAFLSQSYSLFPHMDVWENTTFGPIARGWDPEQVEIVGREMLEMVHLYERKDALPRELSGGMQQRNALARALSADAKILLLDEPLRALDARLRLDLRHELKKLSKDMGMTAIHVTHDQEEALTISDRILVLRDGRIIQSGTPKEIFNEPSGPFIHHFVGEANFVSGVLKAVEGDRAVITGDDGQDYHTQATGIKPGSRVVTGIKTEFTLMTKDRWGVDINNFTGQIERILFLGRFSDFEVKLDSGQMIHARLPGYQATKFRAGDRVNIHYSPERMLVFPEPDGGLKKELEMV